MTDEMKVLMVNTYDDVGGAARAASRLNRGVRAFGIDSRLLVQRKTSDAREVLGNQNPLVRIAYGIRTVLGTIPVWLYPKRPINNFSPALMPDCLTGQIAAIAPDIVHLHWVAAGFMRLETLQKIKRPIVWTLHDSWVFTGGCHTPSDCIRYRESCGACPVLGAKREKDLSRRVWQRKKRVMPDLDLTVVTPSTWLGECARSSSILRDVRIEVIPNGLDLERFRPVEKNTARENLSLPREKRLILFGGNHSTTDPNKGFHLLQKALQKLVADGWGAKAELLVFGAPRSANPPDLGLKATYLGMLHDDERLGLYYSAADVFVFPSIQETLGYTAMEAMACGSPCVAFEQGGVPDLIDHKYNGYLARPFEIEDFAKGIEWVLKNSETEQDISWRCRRKAEENFAIEKVAESYIELYRSVLEAAKSERETPNGK